MNIFSQFDIVTSNNENLNSNDFIGTSDMTKLLDKSNKFIELNKLCLEAQTDGLMLSLEIQKALNNENLNDYQIGSLLGKVESYYNKYNNGEQRTSISLENISSIDSKRELEVANEGIKEFLNEIGNHFVQAWQNSVTPLKTVFSQLKNLFGGTFGDLTKLQRKLSTLDIDNDDLKKVQEKMGKKYGGLIALVEGDITRITELVSAHSDCMHDFVMSMDLSKCFVKYELNSTMKSMLDRKIEKQGSNWWFNDFGGYNIIGFKPNADTVSVNVTYKYENAADRMFGRGDKDSFGNTVIDDDKEIKRSVYNATIDIPASTHIKGGVKELCRALDSFISKENYFKSIYWKVYTNYITRDFKIIAQSFSNYLHRYWPDTWLSESTARDTLLISLFYSTSAMCNSAVTIINESIDFLLDYSEAIAKLGHE